MDLDLNRYWLSVGQTTISLAGFTIAIIQLNRVYRQAKANYEWNRQARSLDFLKDYEKLYEAQVELKRLDKDLPTEEAKREAIKSDTKYRLPYFRMMDYFENLACAIKHGMCEEDIVYDSLRGVLCGFWSSSGHIHRDTVKADHPKGYELYEDLATRWKSRYEDELRDRAELVKLAHVPPKPKLLK